MEDVQDGWTDPPQKIGDYINISTRLEIRYTEESNETRFKGELKEIYWENATWTPETPDCPGDVSGPAGEGTPDGTVDLDDLFTVLNHWGESGGVGNLIGDPAVDIDDLFEVLNHWGPCPT
jgi:hypothetical protein